MPDGNTLADACKPCPAGQYCPTPSESIECPEGSFCRIGSTQPKRCFFFLSYCPPGQAAENNLLTGILASALLIIVVAAILYLCLNWREKRMRRIKRRLEQHTEKKRARKLLDELQGDDGNFLTAEEYHARLGGAKTLKMATKEFNRKFEQFRTFEIARKMALLSPILKIR